MRFIPAPAVCGAIACCLLPLAAYATPTVFPTGTTIYKPEKCFNGFTVLANVRMAKNYDKENWGVPVYDMNGNMIHRWKGYLGFPPILMPGGRLLASKMDEASPYVNGDTIVQVSFDGKEEWSWNKYDKITVKGNWIYSVSNSHRSRESSRVFPSTR